MNILYNFGIYTYKQLVNIASFRNLKARKMKQGHKEIFHYLAQNADPEGGYIWIHASSLGEFEQGRPIIEAIKAHYPEQKIAITFFSPYGYEVRKNYPKADLICYLGKLSECSCKKKYSYIHYFSDIQAFTNIF